MNNCIFFSWNNKRNNLILFLKSWRVIQWFRFSYKTSYKRRLINLHNSYRACNEAINSGLWDEVYEYICNNYEIDKIENIYLNGDGCQWIKSFRNRVKSVTYIIDEFHLNKYIKQILSYAYDSKDEVKRKINWNIEIWQKGNIR